jgi:hypothetical protein
VEADPSHALAKEVVQTEDVEVQTEVVLDVVPPKAVLEEVVQTESVEMQIEVVLDEIPALGRAVGRPTESDAKKTRSMTNLLGVESKTSNGKTKKKKSSAKKK